MTGSDFLATVYRLVAREEPGARTREALGQFPLYAVGTLLARSLSLLAQLYVARSLSPDQFGRVSLALAIGMVLTIPMQAAWGTAFVRFAVVRPAGRTPWHILRAAIVLTAASSLVVVLLALAAGPFATVWLGIPLGVYLTGILAAVASAAWLFAKSSCQGLQAWRRLVLIEVTWSSLILLVPLTLRSLGEFFDWRIVFVFVGAYVLASSPAWRQWLATPDQPVVAELRRQWNFGKYLGGANLVAALPLYGDRFLVNASAGLPVLGIYQTYALVSFGVAVFAAALVSRFLFPLLNLAERGTALRLFRRALPLAAVVFVAGNFGLGYCAIKFVHYPFESATLLIAVVGAFAYCVTTFLNDLAATHERRGPQIVLATNLLTCALFFPAAILLLPRWPVAAPFAAYAIAYPAAAARTYRAIRALP
jgi:O-antigen/teichoic acid export membrane protein